LTQSAHRGWRRALRVHWWGLPKRNPLPWWRMETCRWTFHWCGERTSIAHWRR